MIYMYNPYMYSQQNMYSSGLNALQNDFKQRYEIIQVSGKNGAEAYYLPPNSSILLCLRDRVGSLELKDAMCGVVRYPQQMSYCTPCNPFGGCGYQTNI